MTLELFYKIFEKISSEYFLYKEFSQYTIGGLDYMIGERIYFYRKKRNLTQEQLSHGICSIPYLSKVENNKIEANEEILDLLCGRLEISREEDLDSKSILEELRSCYQALAEREIAAAQKKIIEIEKIDLENNPELLTFYYIIKLRYALAVFKQEEAKSYYKNLEGMNIFAKNEIEYFLIRTKGLYEYLFGDLKKAIVLWIRADELNDKLYLIDKELDYHLALVYSKLGNYTLSIIRGEKALAAYNESANFEKVIDCYILLGINFNRVNEFYKAENYLLKALKVSKIHRDTSLTASILHNLGCVYSSQNNPQKALDYFKRSLLIKEEEKEANTIKLNTIYLLAKESINSNDYQSAEKWFREGRNILNTKRHDTHYYLFGLLGFQLKTNDKEKDDCIKMLIEAIEYFESKGDFNNCSEISLTLAKYYKEQYQYKLSVKYYEKVLEYKNI
jgi:HTH-type transcriptional regulator, quorum sensing regulator NprR